MFILLFWPNQKKVRFTTHLLGKDGLGPSAGSSFFGSMSTPSLAHSLAHLITFSGTGFGGWRTISAVHPSVFLHRAGALVLAGVARIYPQASEAPRVAIRRRFQQGLDAVAVLDVRAEDPRFKYQALSTRRWRLDL